MMGLRTSVHVECVLPDGRPGGWFTTTDYNSPYTDLRLTGDGRLVRDTVRIKDGPDFPAGDMASLCALLSRTRWERTGEQEVRFDGFLGLRDGGHRYTARLRGGRLTGLRTGGLQAWAAGDGDPWRALRDMREAFHAGRSPNPAEAAAFLDDALRFGPEDFQAGAGGHLE
jgi:hypothetical protein